MDKIKDFFKKEVPDELKNRLDLCLNSDCLKNLDEDKLYNSLQLEGKQIMIECTFGELPNCENTDYISELPFHLIRSEAVTLSLNSQILQKSKKQIEFIEKLENYMPNVDINYDIADLGADIKYDAVLFLHAYHHLPTSYLDTIEYLLSGDNQLGLSNIDIVQVVRGKKELRMFNLSLDELVETSLNEPIENQLSLSENIIIVFESTAGELCEEYKKFLEYIFSFLDSEKTVVFEVKKVDTLNQEPVTIFFNFCNVDEHLHLAYGETFTDYWIQNSENCKV